jgi:hypothetical protein
VRFTGFPIFRASQRAPLKAHHPRSCRAIAVLGVDFMSENVRAILDEAGHADVAVYRMDAAAIGCSLAEAAESPAYDAYLEEAGATPNSLHVVYINTSLRTKALAHRQVPTITCTSSNVVQTVLTAFAQVGCARVHAWQGQLGCASAPGLPPVPGGAATVGSSPPRAVTPPSCSCRRPAGRCQTCTCGTAPTPTWAATWRSCSSPWLS